MGYAGGAEVEQVYLARELVAHGYDVYFVTYLHGSEQTENVNGIRIMKTYEREKADQMSVFLKSKSIWSSLRKTNADIYFHEAGSTGMLSVFCCVNRKKFVFRIPSDAMVTSKPLSGNYSFVSKVVDMLEIKRADAAIAQSDFQKRVLQERFGLESIMIRNGLMVTRARRKKRDPPAVLWVGSIYNVKRPHLFVELAKSIPYAQFDMIGGKNMGEPEVYEDISYAGQKLPNLRFHGFVPYHKIGEFFERASIFVSTSRIEGFSNTFIQAWMHYAPVVSLGVDPDGVIRSEKLGFCSCTFKQLVLDVTTLLSDKKLRETMGENGRHYVEREHDIRKTVAKYCALFEDIS